MQYAGEDFLLCCEGFAGILAFDYITDIIGFTVDIIGEYNGVFIIITKQNFYSIIYLAKLLNVVEVLIIRLTNKEVCIWLR